MKRTITCAFASAMTLVALGASHAWAASIRDAEELLRIPTAGIGAGTAAGQLGGPFGVASDPLTGHIFSVENGNGRISEYTPWGTFVKAVGYDVALGEVNEKQEVRVRAAAGQFRLMFNASSTTNLSFNAGAAEIEAALNALPSIGPGGVSVTGVPGTPDGKVPYVFVVTFKGASLESTDVNEIVPADGTTPLAGGDPMTSLEVRTQANGAAGGTGLEVCTEESGCKEGAKGAGPGQFSGSRGIAVDDTGAVYVREAGNGRVQKFNREGQFVWAVGGDVNKTTGAEICTAVDVLAGHTCGIGVPGTAPREFSSSASSEGITFCLPPATLCPGGAVFVTDVGRVQRLSLDGAYEGELAVPGETVVGVAFDPVGEDIYATYGGDTHELDGVTGEEIPPARESGGTLVASNGAGEMFTSLGSFEGEVLEYSPTGDPLEPPSCCKAPPGLSLNGLGTNGAGDLHASYSSATESFLRVFGPPPVIFEGPLPIPPGITEQFASSVLRDEASVAALINPRFFTDATYSVQYGTGECASGNCPNETDPALLTTKPFGSPLRTAEVSLEGLAPGATYHYRFVAESSGGGPVIGEEGEFTTPDPLPQPTCANDVFRGGAAVRLPDCRAYEMTSPVDKNHGDIKTLVDLLGYETKLGQVASNGEWLTYSSSRSFGRPKGAPLTNQYLARRVWESEAVDPAQGPGADVNTNSETVGNPFKHFSEDLCTGWFVTAPEPLLDPGRDFASYLNVYRQDFCGGEPIEALLPVQPTVEPRLFHPELQGASAGDSAAITRVKDKLTPNAASNRWQTYYTDNGEIDLLCVLPNGNPVSGHCSGGTGVESPTFFTGAELNRLSNVTNALSDDATRAYWTDSGASKESGSGSVYLRINPGAEQSTTGCEADKACTVPVSGTKTPQPSRFLGASPDGSRAIFRVTAGALDEDLYRFDAGASSSMLIAGEVIGVLASSEDLSRVYFASREALAPGATAGQPNLYLDEEGEKTFVATLSETDVTNIPIPSNTNPIPIYHVARASADGGELAFISNRSLTGYDNADVETGTPNSEVYLYEAGAEEPVCVSCNPSGQRPRGRLIDGNGNFSATLPAAALLPAPENMLYTQRALSDDGERLFFESFDALVPRDANGAKDVYEWESAPSRSACEARGAELYVSSSGGCLSLISTGESPQDSEFVDASSTGNDVFFITNASLVPKDPGLFDVYDARVGGGLPEPVPAPECQGETCKPPATAPTDPTPSSSTYVGPGDVKPKATKKNKKKAKKKKKGKGKKNKGKAKKKKAGQKGRAAR